LNRWAAPLRFSAIHFVVDNDLVLGLLDFHHLAEFVGLARLTLANDFGGVLEDTDQLAFGSSVAPEYSRLRFSAFALAPSL